MQYYKYYKFFPKKFTRLIFPQLNLGILRNRNKLIVIVLIFLSWFIAFSIYNLPSTASPTTDTIPNTFTAVNIAHNKRLDLTNFKPYFLKRGIVSYVTTGNNQGRLYAKTPVINGIITIPYIILTDKQNHLHKITAEDFTRRDYESYYQLVGKQYGSLLASFSTVFVFFILYNLFHKRFFAFFWTLAYAIGTSVYSTAAQGNWQHAPSLLLITVSYYCLLLFLKNKNIPLLFFASVLLSFATLVRISNVLFFFSICCTFLLYKPYRKYVIALSPFFLFPLIFWNFFLSAMHVPGGYNDEIIRSIRSINLIHTAKVIISLLISPNAGLLIFSPVCIFGLLGIGKIIGNYLRHKITVSRPDLIFLFTSCLAFLGIFLFNSVWWAWEGGYSWGPRMLTEGTPFLIFLGAYFLNSLTSYISQKGGVFIFCILFFLSFVIQLLGVYAYETEWQSKYFIRNGSFTTAWFNNPSIIEFYKKRQLFHTVTLDKKDNRLIIEKNYYRFNLDFQKPFTPVQKARYYIE